MTLSDVASLLEGKVDHDRGLLLEAGMFPELASALAAFGVKQLHLTGAQVAQPAAVTVDGGATLLGKKAGRVHLEVTGADALTAKLTYTAPRGWGFADGFPGLPSSYKHLTDNPGLVGLGPSVLHDLPLASAALTATSGSATLAFTGALADASHFTFLAAALSLPAEPPLTGTILLNGDKPATPDLVIGGGHSTLPVGDLLTLDAIGLHAHTVAKDPATGGALTRMDLDATIEAGAHDPVPIKLSAPFYGLAGVLELTADFSGAGLSIGRGVAAFAELLRLDPATFKLPSPLDVLDSFALKSMACIVTLDPPGVQRLVITVGPGRVWPITKGVEVDDLTVGWAIAFPFDSDARKMSATLSGTLALGTVDPKLEFEVFASSDGGFSAWGALKHPMTLEQIATTVNGSPVGGLPKLEVIEATISAASSGDFGVLVRVGNWQIGSIGNTPIVLYEVLASLERTSATTTGRFGTVLGVGKARLYLNAQITMSAQAPTGWVFEGGTQAGSEITIGDLLQELADTFGIGQVPAPVRSLTLKDLKLLYDTAASTFAFTCEADFAVDATAVAVVISIDVAPTTDKLPVDPHATTVKGTKGYSATFKGRVSFDGHAFDIALEASPDTDVLVADYLHKPGDKATNLHKLVEEVAPPVAAAVPEGITIDLEEVKFVFLKQQATQWAFGLRLGVAINLNELPIVGSKLPADQTLAIENLQILYASAAMVESQTAIVNKLLAPGVAKLPDAVGKGIAFDADVRLGSATKHLHAGVAPPPTVQPGPVVVLEAGVPGKSVVPASSTDPVTWLDVNKQFGIFSFQRVGIGYEDNVFELALDASVALGPVAFSMQALTVGSPLGEFVPTFGLKGLALSFNRPPIEIGGAFLKVQEEIRGRKVNSYYGELMVKVGQFSLKALGGWSPDADPARFFIYVKVGAPIGGPPFLFITGLAGGFGINSSLTLPTIDEVRGYPLLPSEAPGEKGSAAETIAEVIPALQKRFQPLAGQYWVAAGISFTSFEMIEAQAVVSVAFGVEVQIGVVGTCAMSFPKGDGKESPPIAYVEIDVVASFTPATGLLAVDGKLSPASCLFGGFVKLTGGFAFYAWFSGEHRGDFVVSLGGYHPAFDRPSNYPVVPRLGIAFALGPLKVTGESYFALVPSAFMAGIRIRATFEAGPVKAWFDAGVDFLIAWAPFHYEARAWVTIGCSVDLGLFTLRIQIGAELELWGPAFGGAATVDLDVVSFTIGFGAERNAPLPVGWQTFSEKFLPAPDKEEQRVAMLAAARGPVGGPPPPKTNVIKAGVTAGQIGTGPRGIDWILDPDHFRIVSSSTLPANHAQWSAAAKDPTELPNVVASYQRLPGPVPGMLLALDRGTVTKSMTEVWETKLDIGPMRQRGVASYHTITLRDEDGNPIGGVTVAPQVGPSNTALFVAPPEDTDKPATPDPNAQRLIPSTLTGLAIMPVPRRPDAVSDVKLLALIYGEVKPTGFAYRQPVPDKRYTVSSTTSGKGRDFTITVGGAHAASLENHGYELSALTDRWVGVQRDAVLTELRELGFATAAPDEVKLTEMAKTALTDWPGAALIGAQS